MLYYIRTAPNPCHILPVLNWWEVRAKMLSLNLGKPINVQPLNEAMAIELGANLLGEVIIFAVGAGVLILEYVRSSKKETTKEETLLQEKRELKATLRELQFQAERQDAQIRELQRILAEVESKTWLPKNIFSRGENSQMSSSDPDILFRAQETQHHTYYKEYPNRNVLYRALNLFATGFYFQDETEIHEELQEEAEEYVRQVQEQQSPLCVTVEG